MSAIDTLFEMYPALADGAKPGPDHVMVRCPYHGDGKEKTPSMSISLSKPVFFCHGCKVAGHLAQLLKKAGLGQTAIDVLLPRGERIKHEKKNIAARLLKGESPFDPKYVLDETILDIYRLAPTALLRAGYDKQTLRHFEVGYDSKQMRITYPLRTVFGDLVGISGRAMLEGGARYKIYDRELKERTDYCVPADYTMESVKKSLLWHGHVVRPLLFQRSYQATELIIVEGFKACMWTWQAGYQDTVALVGSYLSDEHAELIARAVKRVLLFLDNNEAGRKGTFGAGMKLLRKGVQVEVANYPDDREQPDDLCPEEIDQAFDTRTSFRAWCSNEIYYNDAQQPAYTGTH